MSTKRAKKPPQPPVWLLSIDPAKAAGWSLFRDGKPMSWGIADGSSWKTLNQALSGVPAFIETVPGSRECVIEEAFPTFGKSNFKGICTLGRRRGLAQAAAESVGFDTFQFIQPNIWQLACGWRRGQDTKEWSLAYVKKRFGIDGITDDTADSLGLGSYVLDSYAALA